MMRLLLICLMLIVCCETAPAAEVRRVSEITGLSVRLSDLFSGLAPGQDQIIGPAPAPGVQIHIPAAQVAGIAGHFRIDCQVSDDEDVFITSAGQPIKTSLLTTALSSALAARGAPERFDITLSGYSAPLIAPNDSVTAMVDAIDYDQANGGWNALVTISGPLTRAISVRVSGSLTELDTVPVLDRQVLPSAAIGAEDVTMVVVRLPPSAAGFAQKADQVIGRALRHVLPAGAPIPLAELGPPLAVAANALVEMDLAAGGLTLQGRAIAEQSGAIGDVIRVRNPASLAVMMAAITGPDQVRVDPESQPIITVRSQGFAAR